MNNREELERQIVDAAEGNLNEKEVLELERRLGAYPELYSDYKAVVNLPALDDVYKQQNANVFEREIESVRQKLSGLGRVQRSFEEMSIIWFQRYALAASLLLFAITSIFTITQSDGEAYGDELTFEELLYPLEESVVEDYQWYLDELTND